MLFHGDRLDVLTASSGFASWEDPVRGGLRRCGRLDLAGKNLTQHLYVSLAAGRHMGRTHGTAGGIAVA